MKEEFDFSKTENLTAVEKNKQEVIDILYSKLRIPNNKKEEYEKEGHRLFKNYSFSDFLFLKHLEKISVTALIDDEKRLKYKSGFNEWLETNDKEELFYEMERYKENLFENFFDYVEGFKSKKKGIIKSTFLGPTWRHGNSGKWFLHELIKDNFEDKIEDIVNTIDLKDSRESIIRLAELKIAQGLKLAEVAGDAYASLTAFLGGEGTFWYDGKSGIISPADIDKCVDKKDKIQLLNSFIESDEMIQWLKPTSSYCTLETYDSVFKKNEYDFFMAINHGTMYGDLEKIAQKILKEDKKENCRIIFED